MMQFPPPEYHYGSQVQLCEETGVLLLLAAFAAGDAYYDPGIKMEGMNAGQAKTKRRSQFRIKHQHLSRLYFKFATQDL